MTSFSSDILKLLVCYCVNPAIFIGAFLVPGTLNAQTKVEIYHHSSTAEGDILRARADAVVALAQARLIHEWAIAQRLENLIRECDVAYKRFSTRQQMQKERMEHKFEMIFDRITFYQQLAEIRQQLEMKAAMEHPGTGDLTEEMNLLLKRFTRDSFDKTSIPAMQVELSPEQLQAIFLSDGSNTFSAIAGKTKLDTLRWPFLIRMADFDTDRAEFERLYEQAVKEINQDGSPRPETILSLLEKKVDIEKRVDHVTLSAKADLRTTRMKWRSEAIDYLLELTRTLNNYSYHDPERLKKYVFSGKTLGDLLEHMLSHGLRFSQPNKEDRNLYASIFFIMRFAFKDLSPPVGIGQSERATQGEFQVWEWTYGNDNTSRKVWLHSNGLASHEPGVPTNPNRRWIKTEDGITVYWPSGWIDTLTMHPDGKTMTGKNQNGVWITARLIENQSDTPVRSEVKSKRDTPRESRRTRRSQSRKKSPTNRGNWVALADSLEAFQADWQPGDGRGNFVFDAKNKIINIDSVYALGGFKYAGKWEEFYCEAAIYQLSGGDLNLTVKGANFFLKSAIGRLPRIVSLHVKYDEGSGNAVCLLNGQPAAQATIVDKTWRDSFGCMFSSGGYPAKLQLRNVRLKLKDQPTSR